MSLVCTLSFFLHILINIIRNLNIFCINVDIYEMLLLQKKKGQGINTVIVIPFCNSFMSITLLYFLSILLNNFRNLVIFCMNVDIFSCPGGSSPATDCPAGSYNNAANLHSLSECQVSQLAVLMSFKQIPLTVTILELSRCGVVLVVVVVVVGGGDMLLHVFQLWRKLMLNP